MMGGEGGRFEYIRGLSLLHIKLFFFPHQQPIPNLDIKNLNQAHSVQPINMHFSFAALVLVASAALATPAPSKKPPGPPKGTYGGISQSCSASQSSIHCCKANGNKVGNKKDVYYPDGSAQLVCSQITGK